MTHESSQTQSAPASAPQCALTTRIRRLENERTDLLLALQEVAKVAAELREQAHERRQSDPSAGIFADEQTAELLDEWADRLEGSISPEAQPRPTAANAGARKKPTDLSHRLRETADQQPGWKPLLTAAADEIERYYGGMLAWKATAEAKDSATAVGAAGQDVLAERRRQVEQEGYDPEHDDEHPNGEIAAYAAFYAMPPAAREWPATETGYGDTLAQAIVPEGWPIPPNGERRRELVKAGALILAEIERIDRATAKGAGGEP